MDKPEIRMAAFQAMLAHRPHMFVADICAILPKVEAAIFATSAGETPENQTEHEKTVAK